MPGTSYSQKLANAINLMDRKYSVGFTSDYGMQPKDLIKTAKNYYGPDRVKANDNANFEKIYKELHDGNQVTVDMLVVPNEAYTYMAYTGDNPKSVESAAHFARVIGIDQVQEKIYISNTLGGGNDYWELSYEEFYAAWTSPEERAKNGPTTGISPANHWFASIKPKP